jgi:hypothetical protein
MMRAPYRWYHEIPLAQGGNLPGIGLAVKQPAARPAIGTCRAVGAGRRASTKPPRYPRLSRIGDACCPASRRRDMNGGEGPPSQNEFAAPGYGLRGAVANDLCAPRSVRHERCCLFLASVRDWIDPRRRMPWVSPALGEGIFATKRGGTIWRRPLCSPDRCATCCAFCECAKSRS